MITRIKNLTTNCIIGVYELEKKKKQKLIVNAKIEFDEGLASETDNINDTQNYHPICDGIIKILNEGNFELLEKAVTEVGKFILSFPKIVSVDVEIDKPEAPIEGIESISVSKFFTKKI
jgi:FolB domain-containing protein